jgi:hypothetical protein
MMLAALPTALFATAASADSTSAVRVINNDVLGSSTINVFIDGAKVVTNLPIALGSDIAVASGAHTLSVCQAAATTVDGAGICQVNNVNDGTKQVGPPNQALNLVGSSSYTLAPNGATPAQLFGPHDLSITGLGEFNFTFQYASPGGPNLDVCIGGTKVVTAAAPGSQIEIPNLTAAQGADYAIFQSAAGCASPQAQVNFVAGTNFVQTAAAQTNPKCTNDCVQVLFVGESTVPNNPDTVAFCGNITGLANVQPSLKALVGNVDPTSKATIIATQPSYGDTKAWADATQATIDTGDASVPASIKAAWDTSTAKLRLLVQTFQLAGYQLSNLPVDAVHELVEGANGVVLPGVPVNQDVVAAQADLTAFITGTCFAATPSATPAAPVAAAAKFTG